MKSRIIRRLLAACGAVALFSAICFGVQGGFGGGHGGLDLTIFLLGMPWAAIPWPAAVARADYVWLILLPFVLNVTAVMIGAALARLFARGSVKRGEQK